MPINYKKYPANWHSEIRPRILTRADYCCENCGVPQYAVGYRDSNGTFHPTRGNIVHDLAGQGKHYPSLQLLTYKQAAEIREHCNEWLEEKHIVIVLTIAHLDHDEKNHEVTDDRLKALCQYCHLNYDRSNNTFRKKQKQYANTLFPVIAH